MPRMPLRSIESKNGQCLFIAGQRFLMKKKKKFNIQLVVFLPYEFDLAIQKYGRVVQISNPSIYNDQTARFEYNNNSSWKLYS